MAIFAEGEKIKEYRDGSITVYFPKSRNPYGDFSALKKEAEELGLMWCAPRPRVVHHTVAFRDGRYWSVCLDHHEPYAETQSGDKWADKFGYVSDIPEAPDGDMLFCRQCWEWKHRSECKRDTHVYKGVLPGAMDRDSVTSLLCQCGMKLDAEMNFARRYSSQSGRRPGARRDDREDELGPRWMR